MKLYNTLSRTTEDIEPINPGKLSVYTCGPTVYDYPHVGNWFTFIRYDLLVRVLRQTGYDVTWVMNITDVGHLISDADEGEDKLEKGARREGKTAWDVAQFYGDYFAKGLRRLNVTSPTYLPRATQHIQEQIDLITALEAKGYTYIIDDGVYYDTSKFEGYAAFARLDLDDLKAGARVAYNDQKRSPSDFALWKFSPKETKRDMEWDSPWGKGFPGWHIECSAMSMKYLGETIDIHSGGIDHVPVHHTNEIAQSEAATGKRFANYWMHTNHISVEGEKISKSLGNGVSLEDIEAKGISLEAFRLHVLESHYRSQSKFSWESLEAAQNRLKHWTTVASLRWQIADAEEQDLDFDAFLKRITSELANDLNTPEALAIIDNAFAQLEKSVTNSAPIGHSGFSSFLQAIDNLLGLNLSGIADISGEQKALIAEREQARASKDWQRSDALRDELAEQGVGVKDSSANTTLWFRQ